MCTCWIRVLDGGREDAESAENNLNYVQNCFDVGESKGTSGKLK